MRNVLEIDAERLMNYIYFYHEDRSKVFDKIINLIFRGKIIPDIIIEVFKSDIKEIPKGYITNYDSLNKKLQTKIDKNFDRYYIKDNNTFERIGSFIYIYVDI